MTQQEALERYESDINQMTRKCPRFWRSDARQELRLCVLRAVADNEGYLDDNHIMLQLYVCLRDFATLEYNHGGKDPTGVEQTQEARIHISQIRKRIAELNGKLWAELHGQTIVIGNRP